jgi:CDP-6-deoxy-D-xylo-4-hexulose-3-dehydrase
MNNVFWLGVYPGLTPQMLDFVAATIAKFVAQAEGGASHKYPSLAQLI